MKSLLPPLIIAIVAAALTMQCIVESERVPLVEAYGQIDAAITFKEKQCGGRPLYPLIIPPEPPSYGTKLCTLSILRQPCPFTDYPLFCLEMYAEICEFCDVPLIGP